MSSSKEPMQRPGEGFVTVPEPSDPEGQAEPSSWTPNEAEPSDSGLHGLSRSGCGLRFTPVPSLDVRNQDDEA